MNIENIIISIQSLPDLCWAKLAKYLASNREIINWIIVNASGKPYFHLLGYMHRWWLTPRFMLTHDENGHLWPKWWVPSFLCIRLHLIFRGDDDKHYHDHPADNRSIILMGSYDEEDVFGTITPRSAGQTVFRRAETFHKINYVPQGGVFTLWFLGKKRNRWGFLVNGKKIDHRTYLAKLNKGEV